MATRLLQFTRRPSQIAFSLGPRAPLVARCVSLSVADYFNRLRRPHLDPDFPMPPKRPPNAYALYVKENAREVMNDLGSTNISEAMKKIAETWNELEEEQRMTYHDMYAVKLKEWDKTMDKLLSSMVDKDAYLMKLRDYRRKRRQYLLKFRQRRLGILKPRKVSAKDVFLSEKLTGTPHPEVTGRFAAITKEWSTLSEEEKKKYEVEATRVYQERMKQYEDRKKEIEAMLKSAEEE